MNIWSIPQSFQFARHSVTILLIALFYLIFSMPLLAAAPVPTLSSSVDTEPFVGEQTTLTATLTNTGDTGYGPYFRLVMGADFTFSSASLLALPVEVIPVAGVFPGLTDPITGETVTGPAGGNLTILKLPIGSVVTGGLPLEVDIVINVNPNANIDVLQSDAIQITPLYEFGDTSTGDNGPITGAIDATDVTPRVIRFRNLQTADEAENPPGPEFTFSEITIADIASDRTVSPVDFPTQNLNNNRQFVGPVTVTGGSGCTVTVTNSSGQAQSGSSPFSPTHMNSPGGTVDVSCTSGTGIVGSDTDLSIDVPMYITDSLNPQTCDNETSVGSNQQIGKHVVVRKSASAETARPNTEVTFTLSFAVTEYATADYIALEDILPDGYTFTGVPSLSIDGVSYTISPTITNNAPSNGQTTLYYDVSAAYGQDFQPDTQGIITYRATIDEFYANGDVVRANDSLQNDVRIFYSLRDGAGVPSNYCVDTSSATVLIEQNTISKTIVNPQAEYTPGEIVTFRLNMTVASGDTQGIFFNDYFPLPAFDATTINTTTNIASNPDIAFGPNDTLGVNPLSISVNAAQNQLVIEWPDVSTSTSQVLELDVSIKVEDAPFADNLFLTNLLSSSYRNTPGTLSTLNTGIFMKIRTPELSITKSASPSTNLDAGDSISFAIDVTNVGGATAYDVTLKESLPSGLTSCSLPTAPVGNGDIFAATGYQLTNPIAPSASANFVVQCTVADSVEAGSTETNTVGVTWTSQPGSTAFPQVSTSANFSMRNFVPTKFHHATSESHTADTLANNMPATIGEIMRYRLVVDIPEGRLSNFRFRDLVPTGLVFVNDGSAKIAFVSNSGSITTDVAALSSCGTLQQTGDETTLDTIIPSCTIAPTGSTFNSGTDPIFRISSASGYVQNTDNDANQEYVVLEVNLQVMDISANINNRVLSNNFRGITTSRSITSASIYRPSVQVVEPLLSVAKAADVSSVDAGDVVTYSVDIQHINTGTSVQQSQTDAFDVTLTDIIPNGLVYSSGTWSATCTGGVSPTLDDTDPSATGLTFTLAQLPLGESCSIEYQAVAQTSVSSNQQIDNTAALSWDTLPSDGSTSNATGSDAEVGSQRSYTVASTASIDVTDPAPSKSIVGSSQTHTLDTAADTLADPRPLSIGETVRYRLVTQIPEGTANNVIVKDSLPNGLQYVSGTSAVALIANGAGISTSLSCDGGIGSLAVSGNESNVATVVPDCGITAAGSFSSGTDPHFNLGNLINQDSDADNEYVVIEFDALVVNEITNQHADNLSNTFKVSIDGVDFSNSNAVHAKLVEPKIDISTTIIATGPESAHFTLRFENTGEATAFQIGGDGNTLWQFELPEGLRDISAVSVTSNGLVTANGSATAIQQSDFSVSGGDSDILNLNTLFQMDAGASLDVTFEARQIPGVIPPSSSQLFEVEYASQVAGNASSGVRDGSDLASGQGNTPIDSEILTNDYRSEKRLQVFQISGAVFEDLDVDGVFDASESGIAEVTVVLYDGTSCQSMQTGANGYYGFFPVEPGTYTIYEAANEQQPVPSQCPPTARDPSGYHSVNDNTRTVTVVDSNLTDMHFADIKKPTFTPDHSGEALPGNVVLYAHVFTAKTQGTVNFSSVESGSYSAGWSTSLYRDSDCNGQLESAEFNAVMPANLGVVAAERVCMINRVFAPANAQGGEQYVNTIRATFDYGNAAVADSIIEVVDLTVSAANGGSGVSRLELRKTVQTYRGDPLSAVSAETATQNEAKPGDVLKYRIYYSNTGDAPLTELVIRDSLPEYTTFHSAPVCELPLPAGLSACTPVVTGDAIEWQFPVSDPLQPGMEGVVSYEVKIDQL